MPTFKPTAKMAIWLDLTEEEYAVIQRMARATGKLSPNQLLHEIAERAIHETIAASRKE